MGRATALTLAEKAKIEAFASQGLSGYAIAQKLGRSWNVVYNFLRDPTFYGKNMKGRRKRATTEADRRLILRVASNSSDSAKKIRAKSGVNASVSTVRRVLNSSKHLVLKKLQKKPPLNEQRKEARLDFVESTCLGRTNGRKWCSLMKRNLILMALMGSTIIFTI